MKKKTLYIISDLPNPPSPQVRDVIFEWTPEVRLRDFNDLFYPFFLQRNSSWRIPRTTPSWQTASWPCPAWTTPRSSITPSRPWRWWASMMKTWAPSGRSSQHQSCLETWCSNKKETLIRYSSNFYFIKSVKYFKFILVASQKLHRVSDIQITAYFIP